MEEALSGVLSFIISTANQVLIRIITDLVTGKIKEALKPDIEKEVDRKIHEGFIKSKITTQKVDEIIPKVVDEIEKLAKQDPGLKVLPDKIKLEKPKSIPNIRPPFTDKSIEKEVESRLERLNKIIAKRRQELGLPPESDEEKHKDAPPSWKSIENPEAESKFSQLQKNTDLDKSKTKDIEPAAGWKLIDTQETESPWRKKIKKAVREIEIIRSGGDLNDE